MDSAGFVAFSFAMYVPSGPIPPTWSQIGVGTSPENFPVHAFTMYDRFGLSSVSPMAPASTTNPTRFAL